MSRLHLSLLGLLLAAGSITGCGIYSFTGASIEGKTLNIHTIENRAQNVIPTLSAALTDKLRSRILSQTGLSPVTTDASDYDISGTITQYTVTVSGLQANQQASQNRLTISVNIIFKNRLNDKESFTQSFSRFADFPPTASLTTVQGRLIDEIGSQLADDIFNKAFVNW